MRKDFGDIYFKLGYNLLRFALQLIRGCCAQALPYKIGGISGIST